MAERLTTSSLPAATNDPDTATRHLLEHGVCRLEGALPEGHLDLFRQEVAAAAIADGNSNRSYTYGHGANYRIWSLFNRGELFLELAENPSALRVIRSVLGHDAMVSNLSANVTGPGGAPMEPHWDQDWAERPWPHALVAHVIWMIDDFTEENGATLVCPGSHLLEGPPEVACMEPATGRAGTALVVDGRTWHGTGRNATADSQRVGILAYYCRPYIRQQENMTLSLTAAVRDSMSLERRKLYGLEFWAYLNMVGGPPQELPRF